MVKLHTLIRLNQWKVDERSRALAELLLEYAKLAQRDADCVANIETERASAAESIEGGIMFGAFLRRMNEERASISEQSRKLEKRIDLGRDELRAALAETRKFRIAQDLSDEREEKARQRIDAATLDEIAISGYRRQTGADN